MSSFRGGGYSYRPFKKARSFRRHMKFALGRTSRNPIKAAAYKKRGSGYHPYGQIARPYSSVPRDTKCIDYWPPANAFGPLSDAGTVTVVNVPVQGTGFFNRVGRQIQMKSLEVWWQMRPQLGAPAILPQLCRMAIVYDRQPNGALPASMATIWAETDGVGANLTQSVSFTNQAQKDRFVVLRDIRLLLPGLNAGGLASSIQPSEQVPVNNWGTGQENTQAMSGHIFLNLKDLMTTFNGTPGAGLGTFANISTGSLYVIMVCDDTTGSAWEGLVHTRLRFRDC